MAKKTLKKGLFITFEGPERSGKSTHSRKIAALLRKKGYPVVYTREPGGTRVGCAIRGVLLNRKKLFISPLGEMLLFEASRAELVKRVIRPALRAGKIVITDRFNDATIVYQGYAGGVPVKDIEKVESVSLGGVRPDLTVVLDIDIGRGLKKIKTRSKDRMESKKISFHRKVRRGYLKLAAKNKKRIIVIETRERIEDTFHEVKEGVLRAVRKYTRSG